MYSTGDQVLVEATQSGDPTRHLLQVASGEVLTVAHPARPGQNWIWCTNSSNIDGYVAANILRNVHPPNSDLEYARDHDSEDQIYDNETTNHSEGHLAETSDVIETDDSWDDEDDDQDSSVLASSRPASRDGANFPKPPPEPGPWNEDNPHPETVPWNEDNHHPGTVPRSEENPPPEPVPWNEDNHHPETVPWSEENHPPALVPLREENPPLPPGPSREGYHPFPPLLTTPSHEVWEVGAKSSEAGAGSMYEGSLCRPIQRGRADHTGVQEFEDAVYWKVAISSRDQTFGDFEVAPGDMVKLVEDADHHELRKALVVSLKTGVRGYVPETHIFHATALDYKPWFVGFMSREEAETRLWAAEVPDNTFLVRESSNLNGFALSIKTRHPDNSVKIRHRRVAQKGAKYYAWRGFEFSSIEALVKSHRSAEGGNRLKNSYNKYEFPNF